MKRLNQDALSLVNGLNAAKAGALLNQRHTKPLLKRPVYVQRFTALDRLIDPASQTEGYIKR